MPDTPQSPAEFGDDAGVMDLANHAIVFRL